MAHPNIDARRAAVARIIAAQGRLTARDRQSLCIEFSCSYGAIHADIIALTRPRTEASGFVTPRIKQQVYERDGRVCQYCRDAAAYEYIVEHVVPAALGGVARLHNLVIACQRCNTRKGRTVWRPLNLDTMTAQRPDWRDRIIALTQNISTIPLDMDV